MRQIGSVPIEENPSATQLARQSESHREADFLVMSEYNIELPFDYAPLNSYSADDAVIDQLDPAWAGGLPM